MAVLHCTPISLYHVIPSSPYRNQKFITFCSPVSVLYTDGTSQHSVKILTVSIYILLYITKILFSLIKNNIFFSLFVLLQIFLFNATYNLLEVKG